MKLQTRNFGEIEINKDKIILFEEGLPGFENLHQFIFIESQEGTFNYLQSIEEPEICFIIASPYEFKADYAPIIKESCFEKLGGGQSEDFTLFAIVCLRRPIEESTMNLAAPLLIHTEYKKGIQVILEDKNYTTQYPIIHKTAEGDKASC